MNNNTSNRRPVWWLLFALLPVTLAHADEDDAFSLVTSAVWQYQDNVFFLPDDNEPTVFGPNAPRGDHSTSASVGLDFKKRIGRQLFTANATETRVRYNDLDLLDYDGHNLLAGWNWEVGNDFSGLLRYVKKRYLLGFGDFRTVVPTKNLVDAETWRFDASYKLDAYWGLFGGVNRESQRNGSPIRRPNDFDIDRVEGGVRYTTRGGTAFEVLGRNSNGDFLRRLPGLNRTNSFSQNDIEARVRWQPIGHSQLSATLGQAKREHDDVPERDFDDVYGRLKWEWQPTGQTGVTFLAERQIAALEDVVSSYFRTTTYSIAPVWQATGKLRFDGKVEWKSRDGQGSTFFSQFDPATLEALGISTIARQEDIMTLSLGATWAIQRNLTANAEIRHDERDANSAFYQYRVRSMSMSLQYLF